MKYNPDVYLRAAQRIFYIRNVYSCSAINFSSNYHRSVGLGDHTELYEGYFKDVEDCEHEYWMDDLYLLNNWPRNFDKMREHRVIMLLLMREIAKDLNKETK